MCFSFVTHVCDTTFMAQRGKIISDSCFPGRQTSHIAPIAANVNVHINVWRMVRLGELFWEKLHTTRRGRMLRVVRAHF